MIGEVVLRLAGAIDGYEDALVHNIYISHYRKILINTVDEYMKHRDEINPLSLTQRKWVNEGNEYLDYLIKTYDLRSMK